MVAPSSSRALEMMAPSRSEATEMVAPSTYEAPEMMAFRGVRKMTPKKRSEF